MLTFSMAVYHGNELIVEKGPVTHWWLTAFKLSATLWMPDTLTMEFTVTVKDAEELAALTAAIDADPAHDVNYNVDGLTVYATW